MPIEGFRITIEHAGIKAEYELTAQADIYDVVQAIESGLRAITFDGTVVRKAFAEVGRG